MAKPERHPWPYNPQWNYYSSHPLNFPKIPYQSGHNQHYPSFTPDQNEPYIPVRCPEPRRPYQVSYPTYDSYCHPENYQVHGSYPQHDPLYPKQYVHRPIPQENPTQSYKVSETIPSYPGCSNIVSDTKDQHNSYESTWKTSSQSKKKTSDLDVRKFLSTWQEKDDDLFETSSENEYCKPALSFESSPLDCTKRYSSDKTKRSSEGFSASGQVSNPTGCVVQPYCIKGDNIPLNRNVIRNEEMNNNIPHRNNLNYADINHHSYRSKSFCPQPDYWKLNPKKLVSCEHSLSYPQHYNHCDINVNSIIPNMGYTRPKENLIEASERSQYTLTSSLETGDLFCDINSRNDDLQKSQMFHPYNDSHSRPYNYSEQSYYGNYHNDFPPNVPYNNPYPTTKEPWEALPSNIKYKDNFCKTDKHKTAITKATIQSHFNHHLNNPNPSYPGAIMYEGAFNIFPNSNDSTSKSHQPAASYTSDGPCNLNPIESSKSTSVQQLPPPSKPILGLVKGNSGTGKIKPFNFNDEVSSDDIDISIASTGDLVVEDSGTPTSVISFSRTKKSTDLLSRNEKNNSLKKNESEFLGASSDKDCPLSVIIENNSSSVVDSAIKEQIEAKGSNLNTGLIKSSLPSEKVICSTNQMLKPSVSGISLLKSHSVPETTSFSEKSDLDYLDISHNYFSGNNDYNSTSLPNGDGNAKNLNFSNESINFLNSTHVGPVVAPSESPTNSLLLKSKSQGDETFNTTDNLLLLAHCSQEYGGQLSEEAKVLDSVSIPPEIEKSGESIYKVQNVCSVVDYCDSPDTREIMERDEETLAAVCQAIENRSPISSLKSSPCHLTEDNMAKDIQPTVGRSLPIIVDVSDDPNEGSFKAEDVSLPILLESSIESCCEENLAENKTSETTGEINKNEGGILSPSKATSLETAIATLEVQEDSPKITSKDGSIQGNDFCGCVNTYAKENGMVDSSAEIKCLKSSELSFAPFECLVDGLEDKECSQVPVKTLRSTVIKCSLRWDKIFNVISDKDCLQRDVSLDLGPAKVELRLPTENCPEQWKIIEADNKIQTSSIVQVKRLILKRKSQSEERIPKMIIRKTEGQEYRSFLKKDSNETVLNEEFNIMYNTPLKEELPEEDKVSN